MAKGTQSNNLLFNRLVNELAIEGERAMRIAYKNRSYTNRLYNLRDSYGSAVYYNGRLLRHTIRYLGPEMGKPIDDTGWTWNKQRSMPDWRGERRLKGDEIPMRGRDEIMEFFQKYKPSVSGLHLVIVAAMWYANVLEKGGGGIRRKYQVISGARAAVFNIAQRFNGYIVDIDQYRDRSKAPSIKNNTWK
jgi:hypothetical protein